MTSINKSIILSSPYSSGGEVQKIELIESMLMEADVLIMDEGTSNIDYNSEKIVLNELFEKYRDKIVIFIAHRFKLNYRFRTYYRD